MKTWIKVGSFILTGTIAVLVAATQIKPCSEIDIAVRCSGCLYTLQEGRGSIESIAFSPDGTFLAFASEDGALQVRMMEDRSLVFEGKVPAPEDGRFSSDIAFSPDGSLLAFGASDGRIWIWGTEDWEPLRILEGHSANAHVQQPEIGTIRNAL